MKREFKKIPSYPDYVISKEGRVRRFGKQKLLRTGINAYGYETVALRRGKRAKTRMVHRLVLETFTGPCPEGMQGCHNDGDRINNKLSNLRWDTAKGNHADKRIHGTQAEGELNYQAKFTAAEIASIRLAFRNDPEFSAAKTAKKYGANRETIYRIINGRSYRKTSQVPIDLKFRDLKRLKTEDMIELLKAHSKIFVSSKQRGRLFTISQYSFQTTDQILSNDFNLKYSPPNGRKRL